MSEIIWFLTSIILVFLLLLFAGNYFYNFAVLRQRKEFMSNDPELKETNSGASWDSNKEWLQLQRQEEWHMEAFDGLKLYGLYLPCPAPSNKTVILVHGYSSWHGSMGDFAQYFLEDLGYNVLLPDLRGHGKSEGNYLGFGWHDRKDILKWMDAINNRMDGQIILHGVSMGGSTVLMTSGEPLPENVKCIISDCAYTSMADILGYQMKRMFKLPKFPIMNFTSFICKLRAGFHIEEASALRQVEESATPILFIHGTADRFVPYAMVHELYEEAACAKQLLKIDGATHGTSFWKDPVSYKSAVEEFLNRYVQ